MTVEGSHSVSISLFYLRPAVYLHPPGFSISRRQKVAEQRSLARLFLPALILCPPAFLQLFYVRRPSLQWYVRRLFLQWSYVHRPYLQLSSVHRPYLQWSLVSPNLQAMILFLFLLACSDIMSTHPILKWSFVHQSSLQRSLVCLILCPLCLLSTWWFSGKNSIKKPKGLSWNICPREVPKEVRLSRGAQQTIEGLGRLLNWAYCVLP